jgi:hypothetical protein
MEPLTRVFEGQQAAFGAPGEPGDPVLIEHFAKWVIGAYAELLDWGAELRAVQTPEEFERAFELASQVVDKPLGQVRTFIDETVAAIERVPEHLAKPEEEREAEPLLIEATLVVSVDDDLMNATLQAFEEALKAS